MVLTSDMERKQRKLGYSKGGHNLLNTNTPSTNTVIPTTNTSMRPDILQTPENVTKDTASFNQTHQCRTTRQRASNNASLPHNSISIIKAATEAITTTTAELQLSIEAQKQQQYHSSTVIKHHATVTNEIMNSKAAACIASPTEQMAAVHAKATSSRNKNEEAIYDLKTRIQKIESIFDIHSRIGNGTFSTVLLATLKQQRDVPDNLKRKFAIKHHIPTSHPDRIMKELQYMAKIGGSNNVVGIDCCIRCNESVAFIMPFLAHDRFHDFYNKMDVAEVQMYMKNLLVALRHVHQFNVIHRDVKPSNFLYNRRKKQFLLVDFGLAQQVPTAQLSLDSSNIRNNNTNNNSSNLMKQLEGLELLGKSNKAGISAIDGKRPVEHDDIDISMSTDAAVAVNGASGIITGGAAKRLRSSVPVQDQLTVIVPSGPVTRSANSNSNFGTLLHTSLKKPFKQINEIHNTPSTASKGTAGNGTGNAKQIGLSSRLQQKLRAQDGADIIQHCSTTNSSAGVPVIQTANNASNSNNSNFVDSKYNTNRNLSSSNSPKCYCYGHPQICNICLVRKEIHASRAGTPGYRPPEVLLKYPDQTTAVDVWAAGVIFLSILTSVYPFFKAPNDYVALAEMITIFGDRSIRKTACLLDRLVTLSQKTKPLDLRKLCVRFKNRAKFSSPELLKKYQRNDGTCEVCKNCDQFYFNCLCLESSFETEPIDAHDMFPPSAYDLLHRLLEINPHTRITADEALKHPFFTECFNNNNRTTSNATSCSASNPASAAINFDAAGDSIKNTCN